MNKRRQQLGRLDSIQTVISKLGDGPGLVVISQINTVPGAVLKILLPAGHDSLQLGQLSRICRSDFGSHLCAQIHVFELEHHLQRARFLIRKLDGILCRNQRRLAYRENIVPGKHLLLHFRQKFHQARTVDEILTAKLVTVIRDNRCIRQPGHFGN